MDLTKSPLASKTVWANIIGLLAGAGSLWGWAISPADQVDLANNLATAVWLIGSAITVVTSLIGIYGRVMATHKLTWGQK